MAHGQPLMWDVRCLARLPTPTWKLHLAKQALQPSWRHLIIIMVVKYAGSHHRTGVVPIAVESHDPINRDALQFLSELGSRRLAEMTGMFELVVLFQTIFVVVQRFNSVLLQWWFYWWRLAWIGCTSKQFLFLFIKCWSTSVFPLVKNYYNNNIGLHSSMPPYTS